MSDRSTPPISIMVIEDDDGVRFVVRRILERAGFEVIDAATADEAILLIKADRTEPALVLSDVVMPGYGMRTFRELLVQHSPSSRLVLMSGHVERILEDHLEPGDEVLLRKPFTPAELLDVVYRALEGGRTREAQPAPRRSGPAQGV